MSRATLDVTEETFEKEALQHTGPVLLDFYGTQCPPCRWLAPVLEELATQFGDRIKFIKIDGEENSELVSRYGVLGFPTMVLLKNGVDVDRAVGYMAGDQSKLRLKAWIEANLS